MSHKRALLYSVLVLLQGCVDRAAEHQKEMDTLARRDLDSFSKDPLAMQIRNLREIGKDHWICGEVNLKDKEGRYEGFRPILDKRTKEEPVVVVPGVVEIKGTQDVLKLCLSPDQRKAFEDEENGIISDWKRGMDIKVRAANLEYERLRLQQGEDEAGTP